MRWIANPDFTGANPVRASKQKEHSSGPQALWDGQHPFKVLVVGFESHAVLHYLGLDAMAANHPCKMAVVGSIPTSSTKTMPR